MALSEIVLHLPSRVFGMYFWNVECQMLNVEANIADVLSSYFIARVRSVITRHCSYNPLKGRGVNWLHSAIQF